MYIIEIFCEEYMKIFIFIYLSGCELFSASFDFETRGMIKNIQAARKTNEPVMRRRSRDLIPETIKRRAQITKSIHPARWYPLSVILFM